MLHFLPVLAEVAGESASAIAGKTIYEFGRLKAYDDERWFYLVLAGASAVVATFVWSMYRRDAAELRPWIRRLLLALRLAAFAFLVLFFLRLEKRNEQDVVHHSRVLLLVDVSQSMQLAADTPAASAAPASRIEEVVAELKNGTLIGDLRLGHDVIVLRFDRQLQRVLSLDKFSEAEAPPVPGSAEAKADELAAEEAIVWKERLAAYGSETRLGEAIRSLVDDHRDAPVAGVVVITDGGQNAGVEVESAIAAARQAKIPVYPIGLGSNQMPRNVRVSDLIAPARAFPEDAFTVTGYVQSRGLSNRTVTVELYSRLAGDKNDVGALEGSERVVLAGDGEIFPVKFEVTPDEIGRRTYELRIRNVADDSDPSDNTQAVDVEIVDRKTKVLLIAGGATREYRFLRNQLARDRNAVVDVCLQSARPGISQDANEVLDIFPDTKEELYEYDCIVAFDPDWTQLDFEQIELLEQWVAEQAGGLIVVAGPIHMDDWTQKSGMGKIRSLYPVAFQRRFSVENDSRHGSTVAWPVEFTRSGMEAEFLWIEDDATDNSTAWTSFPGVFGHYGVKGAKPGATVYARYGDPEAGFGDEQPVYFAGHFYGAGRVFYAGSGEMWRLRSLDEAYFEKFYTKLIRHVSQGRLLRGSLQGVLLVERERYAVGETVVLRAQLSDARHEPLADASVPVQLTLPDGRIESLVLKQDPARKGIYHGQFNVLQGGSYHLDMAVPETIDEQISRQITVKVPDLEREKPQRDDVLLSDLAKRTGGRYFVGFQAAARGMGDVPSLPAQLISREEVTKLIGAPDKEFEERWMHWLLGAMCGVLCLEWLIRRLSKLA